jgi:hypothetical protein
MIGKVSYKEQQLNFAKYKVIHFPTLTKKRSGLNYFF